MYCAVFSEDHELSPHRLRTHCIGNCLLQVHRPEICIVCQLCYVESKTLLPVCAFCCFSECVFGISGCDGEPSIHGSIIFWCDSRGVECAKLICKCSVVRVASLKVLQMLHFLAETGNAQVLLFFSLQHYRLHVFGQFYVGYLFYGVLLKCPC